MLGTGSTSALHSLASSSGGPAPGKWEPNILYARTRHHVRWEKTTETSSGSKKITFNSVGDASTSCNDCGSRIAKVQAAYLSETSEDSITNYYTFAQGLTPLRLNLNKSASQQLCTDGSYEKMFLHATDNEDANWTTVYDSSLDAAKLGGNIVSVYTDGMNNKGIVKDIKTFVKRMVECLSPNTFFLFIQIGDYKATEYEEAFDEINTEMTRKHGVTVAGCRYVRIDATQAKDIADKLAPAFKYFKEYTNDEKIDDYELHVTDPIAIARYAPSAFSNVAYNEQFAPKTLDNRSREENDSVKQAMEWEKMKHNMRSGALLESQHTSVDDGPSDSQGSRSRLTLQSSHNTAAIIGTCPTNNWRNSDRPQQPDFVPANFATTSQAAAEQNRQNLPGSFRMRFLNDPVDFDFIEELLQPYEGKFRRRLLPDMGISKVQMLVTFPTIAKMEAAKAAFTVGPESLWVLESLGNDMKIE